MFFEKNRRKAITQTTSIIIVVILIVAIGAGVVLYYQYPGSSSKTTTTTTASGPSQLKLGFIFSYTGFLGAFAETQDQGARAAIQYINARGGVKMPWGNVTVVPYFKDDALSTTQALADYQTLTQTDGVSAVLGTSFAGIAAELNSEAAKTNTIFWPTAVSTLGSFNKSVVAAGTYASLTNTWSIGFAACSYALNNLHKTNIYFLGRPDAWGTGQKAGCDAAVQQYGGTYSGYDTYPAGTPDFTPYIAKVAASTSTQALVTVAFGAEVTAFTSAVYAANLTSRMAVIDSWVVNSVWQGVPAQDAAGIYGLNYFYWNIPSTMPSDISTPANQFVNIFEQEMGFPPSAYAAAVWISINALVGAMEALGTITPTPSQLNAYITANPNFNTIKGPGTWTQDHELSTALGVFVVQAKPASARTSPYDIFSVAGYIPGNVFLPPPSLEGYT